MQQIVGASVLAVGGLLTALLGGAIASRPYGNSALVRWLREDVLATYRPLDDLGLVSMLAAAAVLSGILLLFRGRAWAAGRAGRLGLALVVIAAWSTLGGYVFGPFPFAPIGFACLALANASLGIAALTSGFLPRAIARAFVAVGPLLFAFNTEDDRGLVLILVGLIWCWAALDQARAQLPSQVIGGTAAVAGGALFVVGMRSPIDDVSFALSGLLFGVAAAEAYRTYGPRGRFTPIGAGFSLAAGALAFSSNILSGAIPWENSLAYAGWFLFVVAVVGISAATAVLGVVTRTSLFIAVPLLPVAYFVAAMTPKLTNGWWIFDAGLQAIGEVGAMWSIGVGWIVLGSAMLSRGASRSWLLVAMLPLLLIGVALDPTRIDQGNFAATWDRFVVDRATAPLALAFYALFAAGAVATATWSWQTFAGRFARTATGSVALAGVAALVGAIAGALLYVLASTGANGAAISELARPAEVVRTLSLLLTLMLSVTGLIGLGVAIQRRSGARRYLYALPIASAVLIVLAPIGFVSVGAATFFVPSVFLLFLWLALISLGSSRFATRDATSA